MKKSPGQNSHTKPQIFTDDLKKNWVELIREKDYKFSIKEINMQKKKKKKGIGIQHGGAEVKNPPASEGDTRVWA